MVLKYGHEMIMLSHKIVSALQSQAIIGRITLLPSWLDGLGMINQEWAFT